MKKSLNILIVFAGVWCAGIVLAPIITSAYPFGKYPADIFYRLYGVVCHQFDSHSFHVLGSPFAACIRCTAIYFGFFIALIGIRFSSTLYTKKFNPLFLLMFAAMPMLLDVVCSFTTFYVVTTMSRCLTGAIFGIGMALLLHRSLTETIFSLLPSQLYDLKTR